MTELKPCPFCGGDAAVNESFQIVYCTKCYAESEWTMFDEKEDAIKSWNTRISDELESIKKRLSIKNLVQVLIDNEGESSKRRVARAIRKAVSDMLKGEGDENS